VTRLNVLQLAPGGHIGRFIIWTSDAFEKLNSIFGTYRGDAHQKSGYRLLRPLLTNPDFDRIVNSQEVQAFVRTRPVVPRIFRKKNPLKNRAVLHRLNPFERVRIRNQILASQKGAKKRQDLVEAKRKGAKVDDKAKTAQKNQRKATRKFRVSLRKV